jgi:uncharacterized membrane protein
VDQTSDWTISVDFVRTHQISARLTVAFLYQNGTLTKLQYPGSQRNAATSISSSGEVIGNYTSTSGDFIYASFGHPPLRNLANNIAPKS